MILLGQNVGNKTKVRVDDINNPTIVYTGDCVYSHTGVQLDYCPIIELTFSLDSYHKIASGMEVYITDVDTGKNYFIVNETIFSIMRRLISDDYIRKTNDTLTMKFTFSKRGRRYNLELYND